MAEAIIIIKNRFDFPRRNTRTFLCLQDKQHSLLSLFRTNPNVYSNLDEINMKEKFVSASNKLNKYVKAIDVVIVVAVVFDC